MKETAGWNPHLKEQLFGMYRNTIILLYWTESTCSSDAQSGNTAAPSQGLHFARAQVSWAPAAVLSPMNNTLCHLHLFLILSRNLILDAGKSSHLVRTEFSCWNLLWVLLMLWIHTVYPRLQRASDLLEPWRPCNLLEATVMSQKSWTASLTLLLSHWTSLYHSSPTEGTGIRKNVCITGKVGIWAWEILLFI